MPESEEEFDLRSLDDTELAEQVHDDMYNGLKAEVEQATHIFLERGWAPERWESFVADSERLLEDATLDVQWPLPPAPAEPRAASHPQEKPKRV